MRKKRHCRDLMTVEPCVSLPSSVNGLLCRLRAEVQQHAAVCLRRAGEEWLLLSASILYHTDSGPRQSHRSVQRNRRKMDAAVRHMLSGLRGLSRSGILIPCSYAWSNPPLAPSWCGNRISGSWITDPLLISKSAAVCAPRVDVTISRRKTGPKAGRKEKKASPAFRLSFRSNPNQRKLETEMHYPLKSLQMLFFSSNHISFWALDWGALIWVGMSLLCHLLQRKCLKCWMPASWDAVLQL